MFKRITALSMAAVLALSLATGCGSSTTSGTDNQQHSGKPSMECMPNINCPGDRDSAPAGGTDKGPKPSKQPLPQDTNVFRWGDYRFGSCTLALFPSYLGLTISQAHVVVLAGTGCVGFRPKEVSITINLERWYSIEDQPRNWHAAGLVILYNSDLDGLPPLVIPGPDGSVPLSELHQLKDSIPCKRDVQQGMSLYRLNIVITGISYKGDPFGPLGGHSSTIIAHNSDCNN
jgi:hypothetical protein